ncbi:MAG: DUF58 domain-containing protein [Acidimicrobiia bacterium]
MLTERGWSALGAGAALAALWVGFGEPELVAVAILLVLSAAAALAFVRLWRPEVRVARRLTPSLVHEGDHALVEVTVANPGRMAVRSGELEDAVGGLGSAHFSVGTIRAGGTALAGYQVLCRARGVYQVGPARMAVSDLMRLARSGGPVGPADRLIVYPEAEELRGFPVVRGRDPATHASRPEFSHRGGEDFYTLRDYQVGDDLRRVHWPSSAKRGELMIRQLETPWQARGLVFLDSRSRVYESPACFEKAVRGAASVVRHLYRSGFDAELWAGGLAVKAPDPYTAAMEALAIIQPAPHLDVRGAAARLQRGASGGALILVTGVPDGELLAVQQLLGRQYRMVVVLSATETRTASLLQFQRTGAATVVTRPDGSWAEAWLQATNRRWSAASAG